jgi:hypothetical protein
MISDAATGIAAFDTYRLLMGASSSWFLKTHVPFVSLENESFVVNKGWGITPPFI